MKEVLTKLIQSETKSEAGFTLLEVLVAIALVATMGTFAGVKIVSKINEGKINATKIQITGFQQALQAYYLDNGVYPSTAQTMEALITKPSGAPEPKKYNPEGYFDKKQLPKDPWGSEYLYECEDGQNYRITSTGKDSKPGTEDDIKSE